MLSLRLCRPFLKLFFIAHCLEGLTLLVRSVGTTFWTSKTVLKWLTLSEIAKRSQARSSRPKPLLQVRSKNSREIMTHWSLTSYRHFWSTHKIHSPCATITVCEGLRLSSIPLIKVSAFYFTLTITLIISQTLTQTVSQSQPHRDGVPGLPTVLQVHRFLQKVSVQRSDTMLPPFSKCDVRHTSGMGACLWQSLH